MGVELWYLSLQGNLFGNLLDVTYSLLTKELLSSIVVVVVVG